MKAVMRNISESTFEHLQEKRKEGSKAQALTWENEDLSSSWDLMWSIYIMLSPSILILDGGN